MRSVICNETDRTQDFRRTDGTLVAGGAFCIPLKAFVPQPLQSNILAETLEQRIVISYEKLAAHLNQAEVRVEICETKQGMRNKLSASRRKRRRELTQVEELRSKDMKKFERLEAAEAERAPVQDEE